MMKENKKLQKRVSRERERKMVEMKYIRSKFGSHVPEAVLLICSRKDTTFSTADAGPDQRIKWADGGEPFLHP